MNEDRENSTHVETSAPAERSALAPSGSDTETRILQLGDRVLLPDEDRPPPADGENREWRTHNEIRDWIVLIIVILLWISFQLSFMFLVPGI